MALYSVVLNKYYFFINEESVTASLLIFAVLQGIPRRKQINISKLREWHFQTIFGHFGASLSTYFHPFSKTFFVRNIQVQPILQVCTVCCFTTYKKSKNNLDANSKKTYESGPTIIDPF